MSDLPDEEEIFRFIGPRDFDSREGKARIRSSLFYLTCPTSFNRGSVWSKETNLNLAPKGYGLCSLTAGGFRSAFIYDPKRKISLEALDLIHSPNDHDPLLMIPNPSHTDSNRPLIEGEGRRVRDQAIIDKEPSSPMD